MKIGIDCKKFDFIDCPNVLAIDLALNHLIALGAVYPGKHPELTELGRKMAMFPLDPKYSRILLTAPSYGCLEEVYIRFVITIVIQNGFKKYFNYHQYIF